MKMTPIRINPGQEKGSEKTAPANKPDAATAVAAFDSDKFSEKTFGDGKEVLREGRPFAADAEKFRVKTHQR